MAVTVGLRRGLVCSRFVLASAILGVVVLVHMSIGVAYGDIVLVVWCVAYSNNV